MEGIEKIKNMDIGEKFIKDFLDERTKEADEYAATVSKVLGKEASIHVRGQMMATARLDLIIILLVQNNKIGHINLMSNSMSLSENQSEILQELLVNAFEKVA